MKKIKLFSSPRVEFGPEIRQVEQIPKETDILRIPVQPCNVRTISYFLIYFEEWSLNTRSLQYSQELHPMQLPAILLARILLSKVGTLMVPEVTEFRQEMDSTVILKQTNPVLPKHA
ncbi:hypothetical protein ACFX1T_008305 [Malus domestica]